MYLRTVGWLIPRVRAMGFILWPCPCSAMTASDSASRVAHRSSLKRCQLRRLAPGGGKRDLDRFRVGAGTVPSNGSKLARKVFAPNSRLRDDRGCGAIDHQRAGTFGYSDTCTSFIACILCPLRSEYCRADTRRWTWTASAVFWRRGRVMISSPCEIESVAPREQ